jgi:hypothetical protein
MIDMDKIKLANENVIAVGNMKVNARGDRLGAGGQVESGRNQLMDQVYAVPDSPGFSPNDPARRAQQQTIMETNKAKELHDLASNLVNSAPVETEAPSEPRARGTLANSVAKTVAVVQKPALSPAEQKKANGPSRI